MIIFGVVLALLGAVGIFYGLSMNNNAELQLEYLFTYGKANPGTIWIVIGAVLAVGGILIIILTCLKGRNSSAVSTGIKFDILERIRERHQISIKESTKSDCTRKADPSPNLKLSGNSAVTNSKKYGFYTPDDL